MGGSGENGSDQGRRTRGALEVGERKERVLHTRVPDSLDRNIKRRARSLGMSVSTVVRHVLLNTFGLVEDIVTDSAKIALSIAGQEVAPAREIPFSRRRVGEEDGGNDPGIVGWQEAVLHRNAVCERCNAILARGTRAAIAVQERAGPRAIICARCLGALTGSRKAGGSARRQRARLTE